MVYKFTKSGEKVLEIANELAIDFGHDYIGTIRDCKCRKYIEAG